MKLDTLCLHGGHSPDPTTNSPRRPRLPDHLYVFDTTEHAANLFALKELGNIYTRLMNPTTDVLEKRVAALEGPGAAGLGHRLGHRGDLLLHHQPRPGRRQHRLGPQPLRRHLHPVQRHPARSSASRSASSIPTTRRTSPPRSTTRPAPCSARRSPIPRSKSPTSKPSPAIAHAHGLPLIVDSTFSTPYLTRPIEHGADIVVHSLTKWLGGHGTGIGGIVVDSRPLQLDRRQAPALRRARRLLPRPALGPRPARATRPARLHPAHAHRSAAQPRRLHLARQCLDVPPGHRDPAAAHGAPLRRTPSPSPNTCNDHPRSNGSASPACRATREFEKNQKYLRGKGGSMVVFGIKGGAAAGAKFIDSLELF